MLTGWLRVLYRLVLLLEVRLMWDLMVSILDAITMPCLIEIVAVAAEIVSNAVGTLI
jgi:hypothetical protein